MATVMARLHLRESREFDCKSAACPPALARTTRNHSDEGSSCKHTFMAVLPALGYILNYQKIKIFQDPPIACHLSDVAMDGEAYLHAVHATGREWRKPDLAGQFGCCVEPKGRQSKTHAGGLRASHLIHRRFLICLCWDQSTAELQRGPTVPQMTLLPDERLRNIKGKQKKKMFCSLFGM